VRPRLAFLKWTALVLAVVFLLAGVLAAELRWFSPLNRDWVVKGLARRYQSSVELKSFRSSLFPTISIAGEGLVLRRRDRPSLPPLASIDRFSVEASWFGLLAASKRLRRVQLEGLVINVPPRGAPKSGRLSKRRREIPPFVLDEVLADGTRLNILSGTPRKPPLAFEIEKLRLRSAGPGQSMVFEAILTNPKPIGQIQTSGNFGPWNADDPSQTPVSGRYSFRDADLATIRGLAGILSSEGTYGGVLNAIQVQGETDTPDFALGISGRPVHLTTQFSALVDGTTGGTFLRPVTARIQQSTIVARGGISKASGEPGRIILLDVSAKPARLEDLLPLAIKSGESPLVGGVTIGAKLGLYPGSEDIARRLKLDGDFQIESARFTAAETEQKITHLSQVGEGKGKAQDIKDVALDLQGRFALKQGVATFSSLSFSVPGASVRLRGTFDLISEALDFEGDLLLQAKVSQMTTGVKSILLKPVDPFFEGQGAGTVLPIKITGTKNQPSFRLEIGKVMKREQ